MRVLIKVWLAGIFFGFLLPVLMQEKGTQGIIAALYTIPSVGVGGQLTAIFLKNSIASLMTIFLGLFLCFLELGVYKKVSKETYDFLESLTSPLYKILGRIYSPFEETRPFFRSCLFYLLFIPYFAILVNGTVFGLLLAYYLKAKILVSYLASIFHHAILEIPAMFASASLGLSVLEETREGIISANLNALEEGMKKAMNKEIIFKAMLIQVTLLLAAFLETM